METKQILDVDIFTSVLHLPPSEPMRNRVFLGIDHLTEDIVLHPNGFRSVVEISESPSDYYSFDICCSNPDHINDILCDHLSSRPLCQQLATVISTAGTGMDIGLQSISISVHATLTEERIFLPVPPSPERGVSEDLLQRLLQEQTFDVDGLKQLGSSSEICSICIDNFSSSGKEITQLSCSHVFHRDCVLEWLRKNNSCPMCRQVIEETR